MVPHLDRRSRVPSLRPGVAPLLFLDSATEHGSRASGESRDRAPSGKWDLTVGAAHSPQHLP
jgi:hypothetical protein